VYREKLDGKCGATLYNNNTGLNEKRVKISRYISYSLVYLSIKQE